MEKENECKICHNQIDLENYQPSLDIPKIMKEKGYCFKCAFWYYQYLMDKQRLVSADKRPLILDNTHWVITEPRLITIQVGPYQSQILSGSRFFLFDNGEIVVTNNLTHQGNIPVHFRTLTDAQFHFQNNAIELTPGEIIELQSLREFLETNRVPSSVVKKKFEKYYG